jgi:glutamate---cysteine ligase / carboxylate-amine ligase
MRKTGSWWSRLRRRPQPGQSGANDDGAGELQPLPTAEELELSFEQGFRAGDGPSVGLEEELILVDPDTLMPDEAVDWVLARVGDGRFTAELRAAQVEIVTDPAPTVGALLAELREGRAHLVEAVEDRLRIIAAGGHPALAHAIAVTDRPRYIGIGSENSWAMRRGLPSGLHVHVGLDDPDEALAVYNAARSYLPELAALAANSPFFEGADSGLASSRLKLTEDLPRSGIPPAFDSWKDLAGFLSWGARGGLFRDLTYLWWDLRPRPDFGTLEFRIADAQTSPEAAAAIAAFCQSLVAALVDRHRAGEPLPVQPTHAIAENRWRALRDGLAGELADPETGTPEGVRYRIARLLAELEPYAEILRCSGELAQAWPLLARNGAERQRELTAERGLRGLLEWLADETEAVPELQEPLVTARD